MNINNIKISEATIKNMNRYVAWRLAAIDERSLEGITPEDVTAEVLLKIVDGRRPYTNNVSFRRFLFGCLKSEVSHLIARVNRRNRINVVSIDELMY